MNIIERFRHLPSSLGLQEKKIHFKYLDSIINQELEQYSEEMQMVFRALMFSFKSNHNMTEEEIKKLQDLFILNPKYRKNLEVFLDNIKNRFNMIH